MTHIIFIAGAGQNKTAWDDVAATLPSHFVTHTFAVSDLLPSADTFSIQSCAEALNGYMSEHNIQQVVICGLSVGAMICTAFAIAHPEKVISLVLCGSQVRPNPFLMSTQIGVMKFLPKKLLGLPRGLTKQQLLAILRAAAGVDTRESVKNIKAPTLVICGAKDRANLPASRYLAEHIPTATLSIIPNAGHMVNTTNSGDLEKELVGFLGNPSKTSDRN